MILICCFYFYEDIINKLLVNFINKIWKGVFNDEYCMGNRTDWLEK